MKLHLRGISYTRMKRREESIPVGKVTRSSHLIQCTSSDVVSVLTRESSRAVVGGVDAPADVHPLDPVGISYIYDAVWNSRRRRLEARMERDTGLLRHCRPCS